MASVGQVCAGYAHTLRLKQLLHATCAQGQAAHLLDLVTSQSTSGPVGAYRLTCSPVFLPEEDVCRQRLEEC